MWSRALRRTGQCLIVLGLVLLYFVAYLLWGTGRYTHHAQSQLRRDIVREFSLPADDPFRRLPAESPSPTPTPRTSGKPIALLRIPKIGVEVVVAEGVSLEVLRGGPGHFPGTAMPGEIGNFVVSGHRTTYGAPFFNLNKLIAGDPVEVRSDTGYYEYRVTSLKVVRPDEIAVTYPVPYHRETKPTKALLTLTTCEPRYSAARRLVVFAELASGQTPTGKP
ncbi:MAG: class E sortase [Actinomycetota bacterium]